MVSNAFTSNGYAVLGDNPIGKLNSLFLVWGGYILSGVGTATLTTALLSRHFNKRFEELEELIDGRMVADERIRRLPLEMKKRLRREVFFAIRKLGILQELMADEAVSEIMVNGTDPVFIEKEGKKRYHN